MGRFKRKNNRNKNGLAKAPPVEMKPSKASKAAAAASVSALVEENFEPRKTRSQTEAKRKGILKETEIVNEVSPVLCVD